MGEIERKERLRQRIMKRWEDMQREKAPWNLMYDYVSQYVMMREGNFGGAAFTTTDTCDYNNFLPEMVFDSTAARANYNLASSLIGALFPACGGSFRLNPPISMPQEVAQSEEVKAWYDDFTNMSREPFDNFEGGFQIAQEEYFNDQGAFGISGIGAFDDYNDDPQNPICFESIDAKRSWIAEGKRGLVDTLYRVKVLTYHQLELEYEIDDLPTSIQEALRDNKMDAKCRVLIAIEPRIDRIHGGSDGNDNYPVASVHVLLDPSNVIIRESGYTDMPAFMTRFWKHKGETYGRSPAISAMPDIMELNCTRQAAIVAIEKFLDPPLWTWENGILGGGTVDTSSGALNVAKMSIIGKNANPINPIITTGELNYTYNRMNEISGIIDEMFYSDKISDLTTDQRMSVPELNERTMRHRQALVNVYARQFTEMYTRLITRVVNILWLKNTFGYVRGSAEHIAYRLTYGVDPKLIPNAVVALVRSGQNFYKTQFLSPAARIFSQDELQGISQLVQTVVEVGPIDPTISDQMNWDRTFAAIHRLSGASTNVLRSVEEIQQLRSHRIQMQQQAAGLEMKERSALSDKHAAQAQEAMAKALAATMGKAAAA